MKLYLLTTGIGDYYVIANDFTEAQTLLESQLNEADYGLDNNRKVVNVRLLTEEVGVFNKKPFFAGGGKLLIANQKPSILDNWSIIPDIKLKP